MSGPVVVGTIADLRSRLDEVRRGGGLVGFVPTMGFLHDGHASLMRAARADVDGLASTARNVVLASIFVNPLQFAAHEDLDDYPRDLERDTALAVQAGVDLLFVPTVEEMYPDGHPIPTTVSVAGVSEGMEGTARPTHFDGVATVVAKLFGIVGECRAHFGEKDYQQLAVIRRMVADLSLPVTVVGGETRRESDGLAMSSRNVYLTDDERTSAPVLHRALRSAAAAILAGESDPSVVVDLMTSVVQSQPHGELDYAAVVDAATVSVPVVLTGDLRLLIAVRFGATRLIDNLGVTALTSRSQSAPTDKE